MADLVIRNGRVVTPSGVIRGGIAVEGETISYVGADQGLPRAPRTIDARENFVIPGFIDSHVHLTAGSDYRSSFPLETDGGLHGGVTTFGEFVSPHDMETQKKRPLSKVVPEVRDIGNQHSRTDFFFHGIVGGDDVIAEIPKLAREYGVYSYKHFFNSYKARPGEPELLPACENDRLFKSLRVIASLGQPGVGMVHCEDQDIAWVLEDELKAQGRKDLMAWTEHRPNWAEEMRMLMAFNIAKAAGAPLYCVHMASAEGPDIIKHLRSQGYQAWGETCPHYLTHTGDMEGQIGCWGKVNTTLKSQRDIDRLWRGIVDGSVTNMGTDHCPWPLAAKEQGGGKHNNIWGSMPGITCGMEHWLPVMMTFGVNRGRISIEDMVRVCSTNNAKVWGLYPRKGVLAPGSDADIVIVDPDREATIDRNFYHCRAEWSIYFGWKIRGMARTTILRGNVLMEDYATVGKPGTGRYQPCGPTSRLATPSRRRTRAAATARRQTATPTQRGGTRR